MLFNKRCSLLFQESCSGNNGCWNKGWLNMGWLLEQGKAIFIIRTSLLVIYHCCSTLSTSCNSIDGWTIIVTTFSWLNNLVDNIVHRVQHNIVHKVRTTLFTRCSTTLFTRYRTTLFTRCSTTLFTGCSTTLFPGCSTTLFTRCSTTLFPGCSTTLFPGCSTTLTNFQQVVCFLLRKQIYTGDKYYCPANNF